MNEYQRTLYANLMDLVQDSEAFYFQDVEFADVKFRIFNYRLASYTEFMKPGGLECRGHMFQILGDDYDAQMMRLASLPMEKFFNLYENPSTMDLVLEDNIDMIEDKADGSLISTFLYVPMHGGASQLCVKSKGSLYSDQAVDAGKWLQDKPEFRMELERMATLGYTINMEWVAPHNRIVLPYEHAELRVLNIRNHLDGSYLDRHKLHDSYFNIFKHWTRREVVGDPAEFVHSIPDMQGVEGYVIRLSSGQRVKIKTKWYLALHHTKDNINSPRRLFEAVLEEATDDMKSLFHDDPLALKTIAEMEEFVEEKYNHMVDTVERFYERNKDLDRKSYAILGQDELKDTMYFGLAMSRYLGKPTNYKEFLKGKWKQLGLKDLEEDTELDEEHQTSLALGHIFGDDEEPHVGDNDKG